MSNLWHWCLDNKALLGSLAAFALSEALPFVKSTQWNGLVQGLLTLLQKKTPPAPPAAN